MNFEILAYIYTDIFFVIMARGVNIMKFHIRINGDHFGQYNILKNSVVLK